jgi:hypothetical protein
MAERFEHNGIAFSYPENWRLEQEESDTGWTVLVQSPDTAFFLLSVNEEGPSREHVVRTALEALREDYPDLEADECVDSLAGQPAVGHDMRFISLDLTNTCWTRSFSSADGTVLVLCQLNDLELEQHEPVLRAICASLTVAEE